MKPPSLHRCKSDHLCIRDVMHVSQVDPMLLKADIACSSEGCRTTACIIRHTG